MTFSEFRELPYSYAETVERNMARHKRPQQHLFVVKVIDSCKLSPVYNIHAASRPALIGSLRIGKCASGTRLAAAQTSRCSSSSYRARSISTFLWAASFVLTW
jgi:hypothetical protein